MVKTLVTVLFAAVLIHAETNATTLSYGENFYKYVNKQWIDAHPIPDDRSEVGSYSNLDDMMLARIQKLIEMLKTAPKRNIEEQKIVDFYTSFTDMKRRNNREVTPISKEKKSIEAVQNKVELVHLMAQLPKIEIVGEIIPFDFIISVDDTNASRYILRGMQNKRPPLAKKYYEGNGAAEAKQRNYREYITRLLTLAGYDHVSRRADNAMKVERALAKASWSPAQSRDVTKIHNPMDFRQLSALMSNFDMPYFFEAKDYPKNIKINIDQPSYFESLNALIDTLPLQLWKDYLHVHLLLHTVNSLSQDFIDAKQAYQSKEGFSKTIEPLGVRASRWTSYYLNFLFGKVYIDHFFNEKIKAEVTVILRNILARYKEAISQSDRLDKQTKKAALEKLKNLSFNVAYPDVWQDFSSVIIVPDDLVANLKALKRLAHRWDIEKLRRGTVDKQEWSWNLPPQVANAYYDKHLNKFNLLAGMLNPPFFELNASKATNYAGIGRIIAHEIGHAFDRGGAQFDGDGNLRDWWSQEDKKKFDLLVQKLTMQANSYALYPGVFANGALEIGEIMADLSGTEIALRAYLKALDTNESIDAHMREFFVAFARSLRSHMRKEMVIRNNTTDPHPIDEYRINGTVRNMDAFYKAFDVKKGDKMYLPPGKRVRIWSK